MKELSVEFISSIISTSEIYEDLTICNQQFPIVVLGMNGLFVILDEIKDPLTDAKKTVDMLKRELSLSDDQIFLFIDIEPAYFYDYTAGVKELEDICAAFENCYVNHLIPNCDLQNVHFDSPSSYLEFIEYESVLSAEDYDTAYIAPVISNQRIFKLIDQFASYEVQPIEDGKYRYHPNGDIEIKRGITSKVGFVDTFMEVRTAWFPCMDMNGDDFFRLTALTGLFGGHKFKTGKYLQGLWYLLTLGCCGSLYIIDLLMIIFGAYNYTIITNESGTGTQNLVKHRFFSKPMKNKKIALAVIPVCLLVAVVLVKFIYLPTLIGISDIVSSLISSKISMNTII